MIGGPVYLRVEISGSKKDVACLVEVLPDGRVGRDIGIAADGKPTYVTRTAQAPYGPWEAEIPAPPGTPAFEESWGEATPISAEEFEAMYAIADATLPWTWGGWPTWISSVVLIVVVVVILVVGAGLVAWVAGAIFS